MIPIALLLAGSPPTDQPTLQRQLDFMVSICRADKGVHLVAHGENLVEIKVTNTGQLPLVSENKAFQCVLDKLKERPDLQLGFMGNEAAPESRKKTNAQKN